MDPYGKATWVEKLYILFEPVKQSNQQAQRAYCPNIYKLGHGFWTLKLGGLALESYYVDSMQGVTMGPTAFGNNI